VNGARDWAAEPWGAWDWLLLVGFALAAAVVVILIMRSSVKWHEREAEDYRTALDALLDLDPTLAQLAPWRAVWGERDSLVDRRELRRLGALARMESKRFQGADDLAAARERLRAAREDAS